MTILTNLTLDDMLTLLSQFEADLTKVETLEEQDYILSWIKQLKKDIANKMEEIEVELAKALKETFPANTKTRKVYLVVNDRDQIIEFSMGMTGALVRYFFTSKPAATKKAEACNGKVIEYHTTILDSIMSEDTQYAILEEYGRK